MTKPTAANRSVTAVWREDLRTKVTIKDLGHAFTPSVVAFTDAGERLVGVSAKDQQKINPRNTVRTDIVSRAILQAPERLTKARCLVSQASEAQETQCTPAATV